MPDIQTHDRPVILRHVPARWRETCARTRLVVEPSNKTLRFNERELLVTKEAAREDEAATLLRLRLPALMSSSATKTALEKKLQPVVRRRSGGFSATTGSGRADRILRDLTDLCSEEEKIT